MKRNLRRWLLGAIIGTMFLCTDAGAEVFEVYEDVPEFLMKHRQSAEFVAKTKGFRDLRPEHRTGDLTVNSRAKHRKSGWFAQKAFSRVVIAWPQFRQRLRRTMPSLRRRV